MIYFAAAVFTGKVMAVKIGFTNKSDPEERVRELGTGCPYPLQLIGAMVGDEGVESTLHSRFASSRMNGEWFEPTDELVALARSTEYRGEERSSFRAPRHFRQPIPSPSDEELFLERWLDEHLNHSRGCRRGERVKNCVCMDNDEARIRTSLVTGCTFEEWSRRCDRAVDLWFARTGLREDVKVRIRAKFAKSGKVFGPP
jgi:Meiotically up-regulated gene 113